MTKFFFHKSICSLILALTFLTSCHGQTKKPSQTDIIAEPKSILFVQPKLIKTQGSSEADNVRCGLQDKNGNLWFGTTGEGVYRYDGKIFTQFTMKDGLLSNCVWSILEDNKGNIWFGTVEGICRYDGKNINKVFEYNMSGVNMDSIQTGLNIPKPDYIKMDVDGIEHFILKGGKQILENVKGILIELNDNFIEQASECSSLLKKAGLKLAEKKHSALLDELNSDINNCYNQIWVR
jgi:ligand-binding sensor domain-containing protein